MRLIATMVLGAGRWMMADVRFFVVPAVLLAAVVGYVALNPSGAAVEPIATETPLPTATATETPRPTYTPSPTATPFPGALQLSGLTGTLTYQSTAGVVSVAFPSGAAVEPPEMPEHDGTRTDDGEWRYDMLCRDDMTDCEISFSSRSGRRTTLDGRYDSPNARWLPGAHTLAFSAQVGVTPQIVVVDDPSHPQPVVSYHASSGNILAFEWYGAGSQFLVAYSDGAGADVQLVSLDGSSRQTVAESSSAITYFYPSPDAMTFAFTTSNSTGWRLFTVDAASGSVVDHGAMGSDGAGGTPVPDPPGGGKGPMFIAWAPDGSRLAFGGGFEPPYRMTVVDLASGGVARTDFASGYPGEMRWSPDGTQLAVSTYDVERTHHETWVVDPATGSGRHLMDGCIIVWSPDSRFLAVHGEDVPGIAIVDSASGAWMQLTANSTDAPLAWAE